MSETQNFKVNVVGHQWAVELLQQQQRAERVPQSLLLTGPRNVGKCTVARYFAQYLNCTGPDKPCGVCSSCRKVITGNHPDVRIIDDDAQALKIDRVRDLQHELALSPVEGQYRVAVLANFERATISAANALLKTLEEPASQVVLILTAPDPGSLLPTIVSRCQMLTLRPLPLAEVKTALQNEWQATPEQAELLSQLSGGRLGWSARAITDENFLARRADQLNDLRDLLQMHKAERLAYARENSRDMVALKETLTLWLTIWRDLLLLKSGCKTKIVNLDWQDMLQTIAQHTSVTQAGNMVSRLQTTLLNLDRNVNPRLNLEVLLLKLPQYTNI